MNELIITPGGAKALSKPPRRGTALSAQPVVLPDIADADVIRLMLDDTRSAATKRSYQTDYNDFFGYLYGDGYTKANVSHWCGQDAPQIAYQLNKYKAALLLADKAEATVNRRLASLRSLLKWCKRFGWSKTDGSGLVNREKARTYRDTKGIDRPAMKKLLSLPNTETVAGLRDAAMLRLLCENALRRAEVVGLDVDHFDPNGKTLSILGKGRGTEREKVDISPKASAAITSYLMEAGHTDGALFRNADRRTASHGKPLTANGLYTIVKRYGEKQKVELSPHKLRHSCITDALRQGFDIVEVQELSRHKDIRTIQIYDDRQKNSQGKISRAISKGL